MSDCKFAELHHRRVIRIAGSDSENFLNGLITNDVHPSEPDQTSGEPQTCFAGLLTPQGKILFDFIVIKADGVFFLDAPADTADDLIKRLTFYKLRADVEITNLGDSHRVEAIWNADENTSPNGICYNDPRLKALGMRCIWETSASPPENCTRMDEADYHAHRPL